ncbi:MAG TPA: hypothetical protein VH678_05765 [Xanthobacteraceae bacterium]|jgi:hypothetical protein
MPRAKAKRTTTRKTETASVSILYWRFEELYAAYIAIPKIKFEKWDRALQECEMCAEAVISAPAADIHEMLFKIRLAIWRGVVLALQRLDPRRFDSPHFADIDHWQSPIDRNGFYKALASLRDDLQRLNNPAKLIDQANRLARVSDRQDSRGQS